jgi:radical SAM superfamily enzyme YgiQ (UPF0313 family)
MLIYGNAERALIDLTHRLAKGEKIQDIRDLRGTAFMVSRGWTPDAEWQVQKIEDRGQRTEEVTGASRRSPLVGEGQGERGQVGSPSCPLLRTDDHSTLSHEGRGDETTERRAQWEQQRAKTVIRLPAYEAVRDDPVLYAQASRALHLESNPGNARALVQAHGERDVWLNPPPVPLATAEMDGVFGLP